MTREGLRSFEEPRKYQELCKVYLREHQCTRPRGEPCLARPREGCEARRLPFFRAHLSSLYRLSPSRYSPAVFFSFTKTLHLVVKVMHHPFHSLFLFPPSNLQPPLPRNRSPVSNQTPNERKVSSPSSSPSLSRSLGLTNPPTSASKRAPSPTSAPTLPSPPAERVSSPHREERRRSLLDRRTGGWSSGTSRERVGGRR